MKISLFSHFSILKYFSMNIMSFGDFWIFLQILFVLKSIYQNISMIWIFQTFLFCAWKLVCIYQNKFVFIKRIIIYFGPLDQSQFNMICTFNRSWAVGFNLCIKIHTFSLDPFKFKFHQISHFGLLQYSNLSFVASSDPFKPRAA